MRRIATMAVMTGALLMAPATASAAETAFVNPAGVLTYWSATGQVDTVTVADGTGAQAGRHVLTEPTTPMGAPGVGCSSIGGAAVACTGATSVFLNAMDLDDTLRLDARLPGVLWSGDGDDTATGGPLADWIYGEGGADVLDGRAGFDRILGGDGDDRIEARDGEADYVDCGEGDDRAALDPADTAVNCEADPVAPTDPVAPVDPTDPVVDEPTTDPATPIDDVPPATAPKDKGEDEDDPPGLVALPPSLDLPPAAGVPGTVATVSADGKATLELACPATEPTGCAGEVFLDPGGAEAAGKAKGRAKAGKAKGKPKPRAMLARRGRFGRSPFVVAAGKRAKLKVPLTPMARKALGLKPASRGKARAARRGRRVRARVTVVQRGRAATRSVVELRS